MMLTLNRQRMSHASGLFSTERLIVSKHSWLLIKRSFHHLRQLRSIHRSLTPNAVKIRVYAFITGRVDYCNSVFAGVYAVHLQPLRSVLTLWHNWLCVSGRATQCNCDHPGANITGFMFDKEYSYLERLCIDAYIKHHLASPLNGA